MPVGKLPIAKRGPTCAGRGGRAAIGERGRGSTGKYAAFPIGHLPLVLRVLQKLCAFDNDVGIFTGTNKSSKKFASCERDSAMHDEPSEREAFRAAASALWL